MNKDRLQFIKIVMDSELKSQYKVRKDLIKIFKKRFSSLKIIKGMVRAYEFFHEHYNSHLRRSISDDIKRRWNE